MRYCVICNKGMAPADSLMKSKMICSPECHKVHRDRLPKKLSVVSKQFWINSGMTEEEAASHVSLLQRARSKRCVEYWVKHGFTPDQAQAKIREWQSSISKQNLVKYSKEERQQRSPFSPMYWHHRGLSEEETKAILSKRADTVSLRALISRHGAKEGTLLYNQRSDYRKKNYTLAGYIARHGEQCGTELWHRKFKNRYNSKKLLHFLINCY